MHITVCCCTCRPSLLEYVLYCFEKQTHEDCSMVIFDDSNLLEPIKGENWTVVRSDKVYPTLGAKRNASIDVALRYSPDAIVMWDDDDIYYPWALEATNAALDLSEWSRPSQFCWHKGGNILAPSYTWGRADHRDKAMQCAWGIRTGSLLAAGKYPEDISVGEDMQLALRLESIGTIECDPIEDLKYLPWYVWGPWKNTHVSDPKCTFGQITEKVAHSQLYRINPKNPVEFRLDMPPIYLDEVTPRGFKKVDWYEDVVR